MYTIAFDETINFEILKNQAQKDEPIMLAGIVYKDISTSVYKKNGNVTDPERERIVRYFKKVCKSAGTRFPQDLHSNGTNEYAVGWRPKSVGLLYFPMRSVVKEFKVVHGCGIDGAYTPHSKYESFCSFLR